MKVITIKHGYGNCCRKTHKCGFYPFYHDYYLAYELGLDEDNCGESCDVYLKYLACPNDYPDFNLETRECVEYFPLKIFFSE